LYHFKLVPKASTNAIVMVVKEVVIS